MKMNCWMFSLLHTAIDSKGEGEGPVYNYRPFVAPFFIAFIIVRFILNWLFIENFSSGHCLFYGEYFSIVYQCFVMDFFVDNSPWYYSGLFGICICRCLLTSWSLREIFAWGTRCCCISPESMRVFFVCLFVGEGTEGGPRGFWIEYGRHWLGTGLQFVEMFDVLRKVRVTYMKARIISQLSIWGYYGSGRM